VAGVSGRDERWVAGELIPGSPPPSPPSRSRRFSGTRQPSLVDLGPLGRSLLFIVLLSSLLMLARASPVPNVEELQQFARTPEGIASTRDLDEAIRRSHEYIDNGRRGLGYEVPSFTDLFVGAGTSVIAFFDTLYGNILSFCYSAFMYPFTFLRTFAYRSFEVLVTGIIMGRLTKFILGANHRFVLFYTYYWAIISAGVLGVGSRYWEFRTNNTLRIFMFRFNHPYVYHGVHGWASFLSGFAEGKKMKASLTANAAAVIINEAGFSQISQADRCIIVYHVETLIGVLADIDDIIPTYDSRAGDLLGAVARSWSGPEGFSLLCFTLGKVLGHYRRALGKQQGNEKFKNVVRSLVSGEVKKQIGAVTDKFSSSKMVERDGSVLLVDNPKPETPPGKDGRDDTQEDEYEKQAIKDYEDRSDLQDDQEEHSTGMTGKTLFHHHVHDDRRPTAVEITREPKQVTRREPAPLTKLPKRRAPVSYPVEEAGELGPEIQLEMYDVFQAEASLPPLPVEPVVEHPSVAKARKNLEYAILNVQKGNPQPPKKVDNGDPKPESAIGILEPALPLSNLAQFFAQGLKDKSFGTLVGQGIFVQGNVFLLWHVFCKSNIMVISGTPYKITADSVYYSRPIKVGIEDDAVICLPLPKARGVLTKRLNFSGILKNTSSVVVAYVNPSGLTQTSKGTVMNTPLEKDPNQIFTCNYSTVPGHSGAPVFTYDGQLLGLHWGGSNSANYVVRLSNSDFQYGSLGKFQAPWVLKGTQPILFAFTKASTSQGQPNPSSSSTTTASALLSPVGMPPSITPSLKVV